MCKLFPNKRHLKSINLCKLSVCALTTTLFKGLDKSIDFFDGPPQEENLRS